MAPFGEKNMEIKVNKESGQRTLAGLLCNEDAAWEMLANANAAVLAKQAVAEGVAPLIYWMGNKTKKINSLPGEIRQILQNAYAKTWMQNQILINEVETLTAQLTRKEIPVVLLKGIHYGLAYYPDAGTRPMGDADLLVPRRQIHTAVQIAKSLGYQDFLPEAAPGLNNLLANAFCLRKDNNAVIEIHHSLIAAESFNFSAPMDWFWAQTETFNNPRFSGVLVLSPNAQMLYACAHAMLQHGGHNASLRWFYDIDQIIRANAARLEWNLLPEQARQLEWSSAVTAALERACAYFHTSIPQDAREHLAARSDRHTSRVAALSKSPATHTQLEMQKIAALSLWGKARLLLALLVPAPSYMRWRYSIKFTWLLPVYYARRWGAIVWDAGKAAIYKIRALIWN